MSLLSATLLALSLISIPQAQAADQRAEAERLAKSGEHARALQQFQAIAAANPDDLDARLWIARLHAMMGRPERAVDVYRAILSVAPQNIDALIGLGDDLTTLGRVADAADVLNRAEAIASDRPAVLAAQARMHRAAGHGRLAMAYYERALAIDAGNPAARDAYDSLRAERAHRVEGTYYFERFDGGAPDTHAGLLEVNARVADRFRLFADVQQQRKFDKDETRGGGGFEWMPNGHARVRTGVMIGNDTSILPDGEGTVDGTYQRGRLGFLGTVRYLHFDGASSVIVSPGFTLSPNGLVLLAFRYYRSQTNFDAAPEGEGNNGFSVGGSARLGRRVSVGAKYARGYESHPVITIEQLTEFGVDTVSGGLHFDPTPMTSLSATYQYEWRTTLDRRVGTLFLNLTQRF